MATDLSKLDPTRAWNAYEPGKSKPWTRRMAAHLYRRAGFGATSEQLDEAVKLGPAGTIKQLMNPKTDSGDTKEFKRFETEMELMTQTVMGGEESHQLAAWWLYRMVATPHQLLEKTTLFWHGHFATSADKVRDSDLMMRQNELLRKYALGKFEPLVQQMSRDAAMLYWLDSTTNRKARPNENYGRELMELFCLGEGNYTEKDIKEVARAFTGWELRRDRFKFNQYQHDDGLKSFLGSTGKFNGDDAVRIVLEQPAAPRFIATKLVRYFVSEEPPIPARLIEPIAKQLRQNSFDVGPVVQRILSSNLFFDSVGAKVRSPVELAIGLLRALEGRGNVTQLAGALGRLGQGVFYPPSVKGWDGGRTWIDSSTLLGRANMVRSIVTANNVRFKAGSLAAIADQAKVNQPDQLVDWLLELLVAVPLPDQSRTALIELASSGGGDRSEQIGRLIHAISAQPEFQLC